MMNQMFTRFTQRLLNLRVGDLKASAFTALKIVNVFCAIHIFGDHVAWITRVSGPSMMPTMAMDGEAVLELRMIDPRRIARGDLVTFASPLDPSRKVCKRVVGLPGDVVCVDPTGEYAPSTEHVVIPRNHVWISGDNAAASRDSRLYGPVSMALIKGKLIARVWPLRSATIFSNNFSYID